MKTKTILMNKRAMLSQLIGAFLAFVTVLLGFLLLPSIIEQLDLAALENENNFTILKFAPWFFGLLIVFVAAFVVYNAFRNRSCWEDYDDKLNNKEEQKQKKIKYHSTIITTKKKEDEKVNKHVNKYIDKLDLQKTIKEADFNKTKFD